MLNIRHGGHVVSEDVPGAEDAARTGEVVESTGLLPLSTPFDYLFPALENAPEAHLPGDPATVVAALNALGSAMVDDPAPVATSATVHVNSTIPTIYTYWGQFIDHDLTANTDRVSNISDVSKPDLAPVAPIDVVANLQNLRRPNLDLDTVYGGGPHFGPGAATGDAHFYDGPRFRLGTNSSSPGEPIPPVGDLNRDLPRIGPLKAAGIITDADIPPDLLTDPNLETRPFIGDLRNDENLLVAQLHTAVLRFHNAVVDRIVANPGPFGLQPPLKDKQVFQIAQRLTRFHYQWLVLHDYLRTVTFPGVLDRVLVDGPQHYHPLPGGQLFMPLEYSVAAFRFGHTMVRAEYDHNRNFGNPVPGQASGPFLNPAGFDLLFQFTGNGFTIDPTDPTRSVKNPFRGAPTLPSNWIIEFDRFTNKADPNEEHFTRKIDTRLTFPITRMVNEGTGSTIQDPAHQAVRELLRHLARRNLLRGYQLSLPTGQSAAQEMGVEPLTEAELQRNNSATLNQALNDGGFVQNTPLWFYLLKEAEVRANGNSLGELGSRIVCETIVGLLRGDPKSHLHAPGGWTPAKGVRLPNGSPITTIRDFLSFTGVPA